MESSLLGHGEDSKDSPLTSRLFLWNQMSVSERATSLRDLETSRAPVWSRTFSRDGPLYQEASSTTNYQDSFQSEPMLVLYTPVWSTESSATDTARSLLGSITSEFVWSTSFAHGEDRCMNDNKDKEDVHSLSLCIVIENSCGQIFSYQIHTDGSSWTWRGNGDKHDLEYSHLVHSTTFQDFDSLVSSTVSSSMKHQVTEELSARNDPQDGSCQYRFHVYPTLEFEQEYRQQSEDSTSW